MHKRDSKAILIRKKSQWTWYSNFEIIFCEAERKMTEEMWTKPEGLIEYQTNICIVGLPQGQEEDKEAERLYEETMDKIFPILIKDVNINSSK